MGRASETITQEPVWKSRNAVSAAERKDRADSRRRDLCKTGSIQLRRGELGRQAVEHGIQLGAKRAGAGDDGDRDERGNEAVLNSCRAGFVLGEAIHKVQHDDDSYSQWLVDTVARMREAFLRRRNRMHRSRKVLKVS